MRNAQRCSPISSSRAADEMFTLEWGRGGGRGGSRDGGGGALCSAGLTLPHGDGDGDGDGQGQRPRTSRLTLLANSANGHGEILGRRGLTGTVVSGCL